MTTRWTRTDAVMATDLGDEVVLLNVETRAMHTLNETGSVVWSSAEDGLDVVVERLSTQFAVDVDTARADATELLDELVAKGLLAELG
jgi:hypothetical protein